MTKTALKVKVPGKLFVAGEYAVTWPGGLAIVAAVETDFFVTISESPDQVSHLHTNVDFPDESFVLTRFISIGNGWEFVSKVLKVVNFPSGREITIDIKSPLGAGESKKGYGSSAAVVVGLVKALNQFFELNLTAEQEFEIAAEAHYRVQGSGSLGDVAAINFGGMIAYKSPRLTRLVKSSGIDTDFSGWEVQTLTMPWKAYVVQTGKSVKTDEKLSVRFDQNFYEKSDEIVQKLSETQDFVEFKRLLLENQQLLIDNLPAGYVTEKLDYALKAVNSHPRLVGKISGSGFGENMIVFSNGVSQGEMDLLAQTLESHDMKLEVLEIAYIN